MKTYQEDSSRMLSYRGITYYPWPVWNAHHDRLLILKVPYTSHPRHGIHIDNGEETPDIFDEHHIACTILRDDNLTGELLSKIELVLKSVDNYDPLNFGINARFVVERMTLIKEHVVPVIERIFDHCKQRKD